MLNDFWLPRHFLSLSMSVTFKCRLVGQQFSLRHMVFYLITLYEFLKGRLVSHLISSLHNRSDHKGLYSQYTHWKS